MNKTLAIVALAAVAISASAQVNKPIGLSIRAGGFFPSDKIARDLKSTWLTVGAEYKLRDLNLGTTTPGYSGALSLSVDYTASNSARAVPVLINYVGRTNEFFYSGGVGIGFNRDIANGGNIATKNRFAYQVGVGYDFVKMSTPLFLEAKYFGFSGGTNLSGFGLYLGIRL